MLIVECRIVKCGTLFLLPKTLVKKCKSVCSCIFFIYICSA